MAKIPMHTDKVSFLSIDHPELKSKKTSAGQWPSKSPWAMVIIPLASFALSSPLFFLCEHLDDGEGIR